MRAVRVSPLHPHWHHHLRCPRRRHHIHLLFPAENDAFKAQLNTHWDISDLGAAKFALGIAINRDRASRIIQLSQTALIDRVVEQFGQTDAHPVDTLMVLGLQIRRPDPDIPVTSTIASWTVRTPYRSLVCALNYLAVATRPDIASAVGRLATVLDCYRTEHWDAAIRTRTTPIAPIPAALSVGIASASGQAWSPGVPENNNTLRTRHATLNISPCTRRLTSSFSSDSFLTDLIMPVFDATPIYCGNDAARQLSEDQRWHARIKHFRVRHHTICDLVVLDEMKVLGVRSSDNVADVFTKALGLTDFARLRSYLDICPPRVA
jgi:hypothetical protein